jgi:hypothetical protein
MKYKGKKMKPHRINQLKQAKINRDWEMKKMMDIYLSPHQVHMVKSGELKLC